MTARAFFEDVTVLFEVIGVLVLVVGLAAAVVVTALALRRSRDMHRAVTVFRNAFGGALLLALEILIAADLTRTLTVEPTLNNVLVLGVIVLIRTVLSISLDVEMDGVAPWHKRAFETGTGKFRRAVRQSGEGAEPT